jgi:hypothetical protein
MAARRSRSCRSGGGVMLGSGGGVMLGGVTLMVSSNPRASPLLPPPQIDLCHDCRACQAIKTFPRLDYAPGVVICINFALPLRRMSCLGTCCRSEPAYGRKRGMSLLLRASSHGSEHRTTPIFSWTEASKPYIVSYS